MNTATPTLTLTLDVDLRNPGQFLACCGLLELASRIDAETLGWFDNRKFHVNRGGWDILDRFASCAVTPSTEASTTSPIPNDMEENDEDQKEEKSPPIYLGDPFNFRIDWWEDPACNKAGFKTWSAGMTIMGFFNGTTTGVAGKQKHSPSMRQYLKRHLAVKQEVLQKTEAIKKPAPFNFDSRVSRNTALDLGSTDETTFAFSPAVELLALVGLQRFRPKMISRWVRNLFCTWREPLPANIAAAVTNGQIPALTSECYSFPIKPRDAQGRYKAFGPALPERNTNHE